MLKFGVIAEGPTDQTVIENILLGYFEDQAEEPAVQPIQPPPHPSDTPGGWVQVFRSLQRRDYEGALQYNDYLIIHIDTDVQEEPGFGVPRMETGRPLSTEVCAERVIERLQDEIDPAFFRDHAHRILFAIAVDTIECWLLPLVFRGDQGAAKKAAKTTGCLEAANRALRQADRNALAAGERKFIRAYEEVSRGYTKRKALLQLRQKNRSLELFIKRLDALRDTLPAGHPLAPENRGNTVAAGEDGPETGPPPDSPEAEHDSGGRPDDGL